MEKPISALTLKMCIHFRKENTKNESEFVCLLFGLLYGIQRSFVVARLTSTFMNFADFKLKEMRRLVTIDGISLR